MHEQTVCARYRGFERNRGSHRQAAGKTGGLSHPGCPEYGETSSVKAEVKGFKSQFIKFVLSHLYKEVGHDIVKYGAYCKLNEAVDKYMNETTVGERLDRNDVFKVRTPEHNEALIRLFKMRGIINA